MNFMEGFIYFFSSLSHNCRNEIREGVEEVTNATSQISKYMDEHTSLNDYNEKRNIFQIVCNFIRNVLCR